MRSLTTVASVLFALAGCVQIEPLPAQPSGTLYFPTSAALAGSGSDEVLVVPSSNFDLRYQSGRLSVFSLAEIDRLADTAIAENGRPATAALPDDKLSSVQLGNFAGEIAVATVDSSPRVFVPIRDGDQVVAVDITAGAPACAMGGGKGDTCTGPQFPAPDPFQAIVVGSNVYIGHVTVNNGVNGIIGAAAKDAPLWIKPEGRLLAIQLQQTAVGGLAGACRLPTPDSEPCNGGGTVFASGRVVAFNVDTLYAFGFDPGDLITTQVFAENLNPQQQGTDVRGVALSADGSRVLMALNAPNAVASVDVSLIPPSLPRGCAVLASETSPPPCQPGALPPGATASPAFATVDSSPVPGTPTSVVALPRTATDGSPDVLLAVASDVGLALVEPRTLAVAKRLSEIGGTAARPAFRTNGSGLRLYVPVFSTGFLAVVDVPDPLDPSTAALRALLGQLQQGIVVK